MDFKSLIKQGIPDQLPPLLGLDPNISHAPVRNLQNVLSEDEEIRDSKRTLFLCYPEEEDQNDVGEGEYNSCIHILDMYAFYIHKYIS